MDALRIGAFVISAPRLYAAIGLGLLIGLAELAAWRRRRAASAAHGDSVHSDEDHSQDQQHLGANWAWNSAGAVFLGARLGFVLQNLSYFGTDPLSALAFWQGGFSPWWGVVAGAIVAVWSFRGRFAQLSVMVAPSLLALATWVLLPMLLSPAGGPAVSVPMLTLDRLEGGSLDLAELSGEPLVVNLWATWCIPCRRELPQLSRAEEEFPEVQFVYANQGEARAAVAAYLAERPDVSLSNVLLDYNHLVGTELGSVGLPTTYFFSASGEHVATHVGEISGAALQKRLQELRR